MELYVENPYKALWLGKVGVSLQCLLLETKMPLTSSRIRFLPCLLLVLPALQISAADSRGCQPGWQEDTAVQNCFPSPPRHACPAACRDSLESEPRYVPCHYQMCRACSKLWPNWEAPTGQQNRSRIWCLAPWRARRWVHRLTKLRVSSGAWDK